MKEAHISRGLNWLKAGKIEEFKNLKDNKEWNWRYSRSRRIILQKTLIIEGQNWCDHGLNRNKIKKNQFKLTEFNKMRRTWPIQRKSKIVPFWHHCSLFSSSCLRKGWHGHTLNFEELFNGCFLYQMRQKQTYIYWYYKGNFFFKKSIFKKIKFF